MDLGANHLSLSGYRYISVFTVATSRLMCIELHKTKDEFLPAIQRAIIRVGHKPTILLSDGAGEYFTEPVNRYLLQEHIKKEAANAREQSAWKWACRNTYQLSQQRHARLSVLLLPYF
jgi:hypothetical protein